MKKITGPRPARNGVPSESVQTLATEKPAEQECHPVMGLDVGGRETHFCMLDPYGESVAEGAVVTSGKGLRSLLAGRPRLRVVLEAGTHSGWIGRLAHMAVAGPELLSPVQPRSAKTQQDLAWVRARVEELTREIQLYDKLVAKKAKEEYPETAVTCLMRTMVGPAPPQSRTSSLTLSSTITNRTSCRDGSRHWGGCCE
ncbi:MAG TPA: hypothetical protein VLH09_13700, partial [Bryobacteraceae bacterium]|nr:hypothetical protein [Bryobacteraceae bacterium]